MIDTTKVLEVSTYLNEAKIDIAILNETWFKSSIVDSEFLHPDRYKIFRSDRSTRTHPPDLSNPTRFRRNGGGVLIAVRADLELSSKEVRLKDGAEILAVEFRTSTGIKFVICTCYRVGTLGSVNHEIIMESLKTLLRRRGLNKVFIIGDFNLTGVSWSTLTSTCPIEQSFVESFVDLGLHQCVLTPTHCKGKTLDLLLTNSESNIHDLAIGEQDSVCKSDHFPMNFKINIKVNRKKPVRRLAYNFKNVNWEGLNHELRHINWDALLNGTEPEIGWTKFKEELFTATDKFVKKCSVKTDGQDPWCPSQSLKMKSTDKETQPLSSAPADSPNQKASVPVIQVVGPKSLEVMNLESNQVASVTEEDDISFQVSMSSHYSTPFDCILLSQAQELRTDIDNIKLNICSQLRLETDQFALATPLAIKNCNTLNKATLATGLLALLSQSEKVCATINGSRLTEANQDTNGNGYIPFPQGKDPTSVDASLKAIQETLKKHSIEERETMNSKFKAIEGKLEGLQSSIAQMNNLKYHRRKSDASTPDFLPVPPSFPVQLESANLNQYDLQAEPLPCTTQYSDNFIDDGLSNELMEFLDGQSDEFSRNNERGHGWQQ
ncbi:hypothetical protein ACHWQZ_G005952 [Mnemiopsis leidyi]